MLKCNNCKVEIIEGDKFCHGCGSKINKQNNKIELVENVNYNIDKNLFVKIFFWTPFLIVLLGRLLENETILTFGRLMLYLFIVYLLIFYFKTTCEKISKGKYSITDMFVWVSIIISFLGIFFNNESWKILGPGIFFGTLVIWSMVPVDKNK